MASAAKGTRVMAQFPLLGPAARPSTDPSSCTYHHFLNFTFHFR